MIYILTGAIRSGKTTALLDWSNNKNDVDGLLCPDDINGKRYFLKLKSKSTFKLEAEAETEAIVAIGNFKFLQSAFNEANDYLILEASKTERQYLIIDEIGKLELKNEGLHVSNKALISQFKSKDNTHLILVVRDYLLDAVLEHYGITECSILTTEDLEHLI
ncbi:MULTISPECIES: nucleoside-triphosphatase [unclassified Olleya]|jgi:nucleoside-triphosphatase THEP1|uniref:nucleoside-triphosphatase n=1 Tax=unclassified Olleya TaxID=2615019 RepID=UPI0011A51D46|nr:nucleoside-triphosphatase [Olleya sp. Hel_I_94]TVZ47688.1 NTP hydrolase family protein [Olleya sp. Hel_I_94]